MIEFVDTQPDVAVAAAEYTRLLGYPPGCALDGRAAELAAQARAWYAGTGGRGSTRAGPTPSTSSAIVGAHRRRRRSPPAGCGP